ncbi:MAG: esterase [Ideonella sp.]|nr:esterase [Ideonella sp.]
MTVFSELRRTASRWLIPTLVSGALAATLVACGGGTSQVHAFVPARLIVLGDESSLILDDGSSNGKKYSVNGLDATPTRDCLLLPLWSQALASHYNFVFAECNKAAATPQAFIRAKLGATVDGAGTGLAAQLAAQSASGSAVQSGDLVSVMLGANDVLELSDKVAAGTMTADAAVAEVRARGARLADQINAVLATGARAIVSTVPDMGLSPYALEQDKVAAGSAARLSTLSFEFNARLRTGIDPNRFDGRNYGLVLADDIVQAMTRFPTSYALNNVVASVCAVSLPECTSATADLVATDATALNYLWADDRHLAPTAHSYIGTQAVSRAANNPF